MTTQFDEVLNQDATSQSQLIKDRKIHPTELVESVIEKIETLNPDLNFVTTKMYDQALEAASSKTLSGPFSGVPFLIKDFLAEIKGIRTTNSSYFLGNYVSDDDSELVKRYKMSGLIIVGKTNTPEMAIGVTTEPLRFGATYNPWDLTRTPGGSSGGSATAVASRTVAMAHGNDAGGSIRIPAACCGVFGLRPSRGRNPLGPHFGDLFSGMVSEHALTRSVRDSATLLDVTSGQSIGDPYTALPQSTPFASEIYSKPTPIRIGFTKTTPLGTEIDKDCILAVERTAQLCEDLGHHVVEASPKFDAELMWLSATKALGVGTAWTIQSWARRLKKEPEKSQFEPFVWAYQEKASQISAPEYLLAIEDMQKITRNIAKFFVDYDVWLTPTLGQSPVKLGTFDFDSGDPFKLRRRMANFSPYTYIANATGQPAMSIPLHWNESNLPIGSHFIGRHNSESTLFRLAYQLEEARPWSNKLPNLKFS